MKRISTTLNFALLLLVGTVGGYSGPVYAATITTTIRNISIVGDLYTFEVWSKSDADFAIWMSVLAWTANSAGLDLSPTPQTGPHIVYNPMFATGYEKSVTVDGNCFYVNLNRTGATATLLANQDTKIFTVILHIIDHSVMSQLAWCPASTSYPYFYWGPGYAPNGTTNILAGGDNSPLPVEVSAFTIKDAKNNTVELDWTTISEKNNYGFYVQKSADGKSNFATLGFVPGHGTTLSTNSYSYTDNASPFTSYRLKQVDLDGGIHYSNTISPGMTETALMNSPKLVHNYPNPFNPSTQISFSIAKEGQVSLRVYDVLGREVATLVNENRKPGQYTERFDGTRFASGLYMYVLRNSEGQLTSRMILSK